MRQQTRRQIACGHPREELVVSLRIRSRTWVGCGVCDLRFVPAFRVDEERRGKVAAERAESQTMRLLEAERSSHATTRHQLMDAIERSGHATSRIATLERELAGVRKDADAAVAAARDEQVTLGERLGRLKLLVGFATDVIAGEAQP